MIPKMVHSVWIGPGAKSALFERCQASWRAIHPDWEFCETTERELGDYLERCYVKSALARGEYVKVTEFARLYVLHERGGIYLDSDIELIKPLDALLDNQFFIGCQDETTLNGAVIGCEPRCRVIRELLESFPLDDDARLPADNYGPAFITEVIAGSDADERELTVYPPEYFYPYAWSQQPSEAVITENTFTIHHWAKSWL